MTTIDFLWSLARASLFLCLTGFVLIAAQRVLAIRSPRLLYFAWCGVLLQGVLLIRFAVPVATDVLPAQSMLLLTPTTPSIVSHATTATPVHPGTANPTAMEAGIPSPAEWKDVPRQASRASSTWPVLILIVWFAGMLVIVLRRLLDYSRLVRHADCRPCQNQLWLNELRTVQSRMDHGRQIPLFVSSHLGPALCLFPRGYRIIVPVRLWQSLSPIERQTILNHELAHHQRCDLLWTFTMQLIALPHWFNPIAWYALRQIDSSSERACDDVVCSLTEATDYARALLAVGSKRSNPAIFSADFTSSPGSTANRIRRILSGPNRNDAPWKGIALVVLMVGVSVAHVVRPTLNAQEPAKESAVQASTADSVEKQVARVSDEDFDAAIERLKKMGVRARSFHPRTSPKHWVQIILENENVSEPSAEYVADILMLCKESPTDLHIRDCPIASADFRQFSNARIRRLELTGTNVTDAHVIGIAALNHLTELAITHSSVTDKGARLLSGCQTLESIELGHNAGLSDEAMEVLAELSKLRAVRLTDALSVTRVRALNAIDGLSELDLVIGSPDEIELFQDLHFIGALESLAISGKSIDESAIAFVAEHAPNLQTLYLRESQGVSAKAVESLSRLPLKTLSLARTNITDAGASLLKPLKDLSWLDLSQTAITDRSLIAIGNMKQLRTLILLGTQISESGLKRLKGLRQLGHIDLQLTAVRSIPAWMKAKPRLYVSFDGGNPMAAQPPHANDNSDLANAVAQFNQKAAQHPIGKFEPALSVEEVVAAIRGWSRRKIAVEDSTFEIFQTIAETKELPLGANLSFTSSWKTNEFRYTVWWIDLDVMTGPMQGYTYRIRSRLLASERSKAPIED